MQNLRRLASGLGCLCVLAPRLVTAGTVTVHVAGYTYSPFVTISSFSVDDLELDAAGNLYVCSNGDIRRVTPQAVETPWSSATANDIVLDNTGAAYGAGRSVCDCIVSILPNGSYSTLHADSLAWTFVAMGHDGTLYSNVWVGTGQGLYTIDRTTGVPTLVVSGGPGPGGTGSYAGMLVGQDGKLYTCGNSAGSDGIFRLDGGQFTRIASWPHGSLQLAQDNQGIFYTALSVQRPDGSIAHEVWMNDPSSGTATLLADGPGSSSALVYDRLRNRLYVQNGLDIYIIEKGVTPTRRETWSAVKAKFR